MQLNTTSRSLNQQLAMGLWANLSLQTNPEQFSRSTALDVGVSLNSEAHQQGWLTKIMVNRNPKHWADHHKFEGLVPLTNFQAQMVNSNFCSP